MPTNRYRWVVVAVFFLFMFLHQSDKLLIGPLTTPIMETFEIDEVQMGAVFTGALVVGALMYLAVNTRSRTYVRVVQPYMRCSMLHRPLTMV